MASKDSAHSAFPADTDVGGNVVGKE